MKEMVLQCRNLCKQYQVGPQAVEILKNINFEVVAGEKIAIIGASGAGKTTLLNMLGGLDLPTSGDIIIKGQHIAKLAEAQRSALRNQSLGFVYQFHHLLPEFSAIENVMMPQLIGGIKKTLAYDEAKILLDKVGLGHRLSHKPSELSGGERQRVAIARALVNKPDFVLLDEPTGNLDVHTAQTIHALIHELNQTLSTSFIIVTHNPVLAATMERVFVLDDGQLVEQLKD